MTETSVTMSKEERARQYLLDSAIAHCEDALAALKRAKSQQNYPPAISACVSIATEHCAKAEHKIFRLIQSMSVNWKPEENTGSVTVEPEMMKPGNVVDVLPVLDPDGDAI